ncbi:MAG TPA: hypothetical protein VND64_32885 [Pirellulales bacterium]|nr:hypothetical protein [Pirellulales bacterium]
MMAPTAIVAGAFGYLCWPYANDPAAKPEARGAAKATETLAALLSPPAAPAPERDPFNSKVLPKSATSATAQDAKSTAIKSQEAKATAAPPRAAETLIATTLGDLALQGTHIQGRRRLAVINGSVYAEGDEIATSGTMTGPYKVVRVFAHRVEVLCDGQAVELTYSGHEPKAN